MIFYNYVKIVKLEIFLKLLLIIKIFINYLESKIENLLFSLKILNTYFKFLWKKLIVNIFIIKKLKRVINKN